jgi:hypothetical protein
MVVIAVATVAAVVVGKVGEGAGVAAQAAMDS